MPQPRPPWYLAARLLLALTAPLALGGPFGGLRNAVPAPGYQSPDQQLHAAEPD